jgi:dimethylsulfoniopropionate demethylase
MNPPLISRSRRLRTTPFNPGVERAGVKGYTVYNRMLLPTVFETLQADCEHLKRAVQIWDVSCERQVELTGPDAGRLMQMLTPRNLTKMVAGQCFYVPIVDGNGGMLNDPVAVKIADDHWWISIADSDLLLWVKGIAQGARLDVAVEEPDVSPLAVQGPRADDLMARVFGEAVRDVRFFRYGWFEFQGRRLAVARSGYSKQGGFEIYVDGGDIGMPLWDALMTAGADLEVRAGCPNLIERIEGGLLSYGNDMTRANNPFECGLGKFCNLDQISDCIGHAALSRIAQAGPARQIRAISVPGEAVPTCTEAWPLLADGQPAGQVTSAVFSPNLGLNVAIGMVERAHWASGTRLSLLTPAGPREAVIEEKFWA